MKLYLAGMESILNSYKEFDLHPTDNVFGSYFYKPNTTKLLLELERREHKGLITVDSGAHTFFGYAGTSSATHHQQQANKDKMPDPDKYVDAYYSWVKENWDRLSYFVELDIQAIVGIKKVKEWRKRMSKEGIYKKCITVFHSVDKWDDYIEMLETSESGYVGIEGLRAGSMGVPYMKCLKEAYARNVKVHGFALTNSSIIMKYPFYSVDSTTWTSTVRYGSFINIDENYILSQKIPKKDNYFRYNIDVDLVSKNKSYESAVKKLNHSAKGFRTLEKNITELWEARGVKWDR